VEIVRNTGRRCPAALVTLAQQEFVMVRNVDRATGWWLFAAIPLGVAGVLNIIWGIAAIGDSTFFVANQKYILSGLNTWGWIILIIGVVELVAALSLASGGGFGRWVGIIVASLNAISALMSIPAYPFWALCVFALAMIHHLPAGVRAHSDALLGAGSGRVVRGPVESPWVPASADRGAPGGGAARARRERDHPRRGADESERDADAGDGAVTAKPAMIRVRCGRRFASRSGGERRGQDAERRGGEDDAGFDRGPIPPIPLIAPNALAREVRSLNASVVRM
jgi:hypothetical protein